MAEMTIQPNDLRGAAEKFDQAGKDLDEILKTLDETTTDLKTKWEAASKQVFYKQYGEIRQYMEGMKFLITHVSKEMQAMAERFDKADQ
jgi:WXG100 family type VII secretion target